MPTAMDDKFQGIVQLLVQDKLLEKDAACDYATKAAKAKSTFQGYLVANQILPADQIALSLAQNFGVPILDLNCVDIESIPSDLCNEKLIKRHNVVPLFKKGN